MSRRYLAAVAASAVLVTGCAATGETQDKVVYHINMGNAQASDGLRNIHNHLEAKPNTRIVVVTHSLGIDFLLKGAQDKNGNRYLDQVERLKLQGVKFEVCEIAMRSRKLTKDNFIEYATFVPSGVAEVTRLQQHEGYAYLKP
jgi:intracellular sulfur oxidation DsrE/DsrF family protein